jgi:type I restriction-modification system DNA methylase subunit
MPGTDRLNAMARTRKTGNGGEPLGFEPKLWAGADKMRGHMDPAEYRHVALGLIFLKYIPDASRRGTRRFASAEGKGGGFYTARCVVKLLVEMIELSKAASTTPAAAGGMFVQSERGSRDDVAT